MPAARDEEMTKRDRRRDRQTERQAEEGGGRTPLGLPPPPPFVGRLANDRGLRYVHGRRRRRRRKRRQCEPRAKCGWFHGGSIEAKIDRQSSERRLKPCESADLNGAFRHPNGTPIEVSERSNVGFVKLFF